MNRLVFGEIFVAHIINNIVRIRFSGWEADEK